MTEFMARSMLSLEDQGSVLVAKFNEFEKKLVNTENTTLKGTIFERFAIKILNRFYDGYRENGFIEGYKIWPVGAAKENNPFLLKFLERMGVKENGKAMTRDRGFDAYVRVLYRDEENESRTKETLDLVQVKFCKPGRKFDVGLVSSSSHEHERIQDLNLTTVKPRLIYFTNLEVSDISERLVDKDIKRNKDVFVFNKVHIMRCITNEIIDEFLEIDNIDHHNTCRLLNSTKPQSSASDSAKATDPSKKTVLAMIKSSDLPSDLSSMSKSKLHEFCDKHKIRYSASMTVNELRERIKNIADGTYNQLLDLQKHELKNYLDEKGILHTPKDTKIQLLEKLGIY